jgi:hypothetical protein
VLPIHVEPHPDRHSGIGGEGLFENEDGGLILSDAASIHRPAALVTVRVKGAFHGETAFVLLMGGPGIDEFDGNRLSVGRLLDDQIAQGEISVVRATRPFLRQGFVGQRLDAQRRGSGRDIGARRVLVVCRCGPAREPGSVALPGQRRIRRGRSPTPAPGDARFRR